MKKKAIFAGSFDPITSGHIEILQRGLLLFDEIVVAIGINTAKNYAYPLEQRTRWIEEIFANEPRISVASFASLTVDFCKEVGAGFLLRGLRNAPDFEYEKNIDLLNKHLDPSIETVYMFSSPQTSHISSTLVREIIRFKGNLNGLTPPNIITDIYK